MNSSAVFDTIDAGWYLRAAVFVRRKRGKRRHRGAALLLIALLAGCATVPAGSRRDDVADALVRGAAGAPTLPVDESVFDLVRLDAVLTAEGAVRIAVNNHPAVRAELARLDAAAAARVQVGLLRNPMLSLMALRPEDGGRWRLDYGLMQSLYDLVTRSRREAVAEAAQARVAAEVSAALLAHAQDTAMAYYAAVAVQARLRPLATLVERHDERVRLLTAISAQGLDDAAGRLRAQSALASAQARFAEAKAEEASRRAALAERLGLSSATALHLPDALPALPAAALDADVLHALAVEHRPELHAARASVAEAEATRVISGRVGEITDIDAGFAGMRESDGMRLTGIEIRMLLPVFDTGAARRAGAAADVAAARHRMTAQERRVPLEVELSLARIAALQSTLEHAQERVQRDAERYELARRAYRQGAVDYAALFAAAIAQESGALAVLDAHQALWSAWIDLERATATAWRDG